MTQWKKPIMNTERNGELWQEDKMMQFMRRIWRRKLYLRLIEIQ